jgi:hypothetical protein
MNKKPYIRFRKRRKKKKKVEMKYVYPPKMN